MDEQVYVTTQQSWFTAAVVNTTSLSRVFVLESADGIASLAFTAYQAFELRGVRGVVAVDVDLVHLESLITSFGFDATSSAIFITEDSTRSPGGMEIVAASAGGPRFVVDGTVQRALTTDADDGSFISEVHMYISNAGGVDEVSGQTLQVGQGVERVWMSVSSFSKGDIEWDLVVAFRQMTFTVGIADWQDVAFLVGGGSIIVTAFVTLSVSRTCGCSCARHATPCFCDLRSVFLLFAVRCWALLLWFCLDAWHNVFVFLLLFFWFLLLLFFFAVCCVLWHPHRPSPQPNARRSWKAGACVTARHLTAPVFWTFSSTTWCAV